MTARDSESKERARHLMMGALDGELDAAERKELEGLLESDDEIRRDWEKMSEVKQVTQSLSYRSPPDEIWDDYWTSVYNRVERGVGWILLSVGTLILIGFGIWEALEALLVDASIPGFLKIAIFTAVFGGVMLMFSVAREKWFTQRRDPYREIQR